MYGLRVDAYVLNSRTGNSWSHDLLLEKPQPMRDIGLPWPQRQDSLAELKIIRFAASKSIKPPSDE